MRQNIIFYNSKDDVLLYYCIFLLLNFSVPLTFIFPFLKPKRENKMPSESCYITFRRHFGMSINKLFYVVMLLVALIGL